MKKGYVSDAEFRFSRNQNGLDRYVRRNDPPERSITETRKPKSAGPVRTGYGSNSGSTEIDRHVQDLTKRFQAIKLQLAFLESRAERVLSPTRDLMDKVRKDHSTEENDFRNASFTNGHHQGAKAAYNRGDLANDISLMSVCGAKGLGVRTPFASIPAPFCDIDTLNGNGNTGVIMGWGQQPSVGKRLRNDEEKDKNCGIGDFEVDEEMKGYLVQKRSRDASPNRVTECGDGIPAQCLNGNGGYVDIATNNGHLNGTDNDIVSNKQIVETGHVKNTAGKIEKPSKSAGNVTSYIVKKPVSPSKVRGIRYPLGRKPRHFVKKRISPSTSSSSGSEIRTRNMNPEDEEETETEVDDSTVDELLGWKDEGEDEEGSASDMNIPNVVKDVVPPIRPSRFPYVPPYINFCSHEEQVARLPEDIAQHLKWRLSTITPNVIRKTVLNSGFRLLRNTVEWSGQWGKHMKCGEFRSTLKDYQKLNHLPGTFQLGRKDRLWKNVYKFILKYGKSQFGFLPRTFCLPHDMKQLKHIWNSSEAKGKMWIVKPPAGARGTGIRVVSKWNQLPKKKPVIVQQYIAKPLLINERKFDLRLYVLVTSSHPLRMYLYDDGLVRFAPVKYSQDKNKVSDRFMHLTNYSVNKNCELYTQNEDANACQGHKWTLKSLWKYFEANGIDPIPIIKRIEDILIKTFLSAEECISNLAFNLPNKYSGYELFGFDIILDEALKPWLLEVNISPSLHSASALDLAVKGRLVKEVFNIVGFQLPPTLSKSSKKLFVRKLDQQLLLEKPTFDKRLFTTILSKEEKAKHSQMKEKYETRTEYLTEILETLTPDDVRHLIVAEDELSQCNAFRRIFPTSKTHSYFDFMEGPRYYNMLMDAWESAHEGDRTAGVNRLRSLCHQKLHLSTEPLPSLMISSNPSAEAPPSVGSVSSADSNASTTSETVEIQSGESTKTLTSDNFDADSLSKKLPLTERPLVDAEVVAADQKKPLISSYICDDLLPMNSPQLLTEKLLDKNSLSSANVMEYAPVC